MHLDRLVNKLVEQLSNPNWNIRRNAVVCLGDMGLDWKPIVVGIIPLLTDKQVSYTHENNNNNNN